MSQTGELPTRHETDVCTPVSPGHKDFLFYFSPQGGFAVSHLVTAGFIQFGESVCALSFYLNQNLSRCQAGKAYSPSMKV